MKNKSFIYTIVLLFLTAFGTSLVPAAKANDVYIVAADEYGTSNFMLKNGDDKLSDQTMMANTGWIPYGNGLGDFDNDGDLDYIVASGISEGAVHLFEKLDSGNNFALPIDVAYWDSAYFPGKIAVADFNGDDNLDFILTYYYLDYAHLYFGDGYLGFGDPILIPGSTPYDSIAADAGDFDNDGNADFVSAPSYYETELYVNFGNGDGTFETVTFNVYNQAYYLGIAAADFDGDGDIDFAATATEAIDIYWGGGQRDFFFGQRLFNPNIWDSPIDNYDVNSDGLQDLIVGSYGPSGSGDVVAVLIGDGTGNFTESEDEIYPGGDSARRIAIAAPAPPPMAAPNEDPVAVIVPDELNVKAGKRAQFSAAESYDPDGEIVNYSWDFGIGETVEGIDVTHVFHEAGDHTVTLTVTDDQGATTSITAVAHVAALRAQVLFKPRTLNLNSNGKWVNAYIRLPRKYNPKQIDLDSLCIVDPKTGEKIVAASKGRSKRWWRIYVAKFDRKKLIDCMENPARKIKLKVEGQVLTEDGPVDFEGKGKIRAVKPKPKKEKKGWWKWWKR
jgi:hypothetical protein